jgi:YbbR domain-containing protein
MKRTIQEKSNSLLTKFSPKRLDKRLSVFIICLLFSASFWLLTVFSKEYTADISYNAFFLNLPSDKILIEELPSKIKIKIKASGFALLGVQYSSKYDTLFIDASNVKKYLSGKTANEIYYLLLNNQLSLMAEQLGGSMKVEKIFPDTVTFVFDQKSQKIVPVKLNLTYSFAKQYQLNGKVKVIPSNIIIKGPKSMLDQIDFLETKPHSINNIGSTKRHLIPLELKYNKAVDFGIKSVVAEIPVEKYTEAEIILPINIKNVPFGFVVKTFPSQVKIKYNVSLDNYDLVKPEQFKVEANIAQTNDVSNNRIKVRLVKQPTFVSKAKIIDNQVEFIMRKL